MGWRGKLSCRWIAGCSIAISNISATKRRVLLKLSFGSCNFLKTHEEKSNDSRRSFLLPSKVLPFVENPYVPNESRIAQYGSHPDRFSRLLRSEHGMHLHALDEFVQSDEQYVDGSVANVSCVSTAISVIWEKARSNSCDANHDVLQTCHNWMTSVHRPQQPRRSVDGLLNSFAKTVSVLAGSKDAFIVMTMRLDSGLIGLRVGAALRSLGESRWSGVLPRSGQGLESRINRAGHACNAYYRDRYGLASKCGIGAKKGWTATKMRTSEVGCICTKWSCVFRLHRTSACLCRYRARHLQLFTED